ncbi:MAG: Zn-dependent alcohol dehydrogenase [Candidatus Binatia bacterium]|nr:Zn-dependent alcohol dehydrogenase [Candidatus Binatia bacterium]
MKAAVLNEPDQPLDITNIQIDKPGPREVLLRTVASGVCHSDLHLIRRRRGPIVPGHEPAGIVEQVGDDVTYVKPGDRVIACLSIFCGICDFCTSGRTHLCGGLMFDRQDGEPSRLSLDGTPVAQMAQLSSFAEQMLVPENSLVKIREEMPLDCAALIGCGVTTGLGAALYRARIEAGSTCAVVGCGGVGLSIIQGCRIAGATRIIAIDTQEWKLDLAKKIGATDGVNASEGKAAKQVKELTGGGVDYSFEAVGTNATARQAYDMAKRGGTAVLVGVITEREPLALPGFDVVMNEKQLIGSTMGSVGFRIAMPRFVDLYLNGQLLLDEIISARRPLEEINVCFDEMREGSAARNVIMFE